MSRYFFIIQKAEGVKDDTHGMSLPDDAAALCYAQRAISELEMEHGFRDPTAIMIVKNEKHETVLSIPFLPACA